MSLMRTWLQIINLKELKVGWGKDADGTFFILNSQINLSASR